MKMDENGSPCLSVSPVPRFFHSSINRSVGDIWHQWFGSVLSLNQALHGGSQHLLIQLHGNVVVLGDVLLGTLQLVIGFLWIS